MIQSVGPDGRFLFVNRAWLDTMGYTEDEVRSLSLFQVIHLGRSVTAGSCLPTSWQRAPWWLFKPSSWQDGRSVLVEGNVMGRCVDGRLIATQAIFRTSPAPRVQSVFTSGGRVMTR
jgi:PAS domain S-box-containing protein